MSLLCSIFGAHDYQPTEVFETGITYQPPIANAPKQEKKIIAFYGFECTRCHKRKIEKNPAEEDSHYPVVTKKAFNWLNRKEEPNPTMLKVVQK